MAGMSLIEVMVAVMLLSVLMLGLFSAFYHTQRALKLSASQTDVLEGGRSTTSLLVRELQEMTASNQREVFNFVISTPVTPIAMPLPGSFWQTNILQECFFLTRNSDVWTGIGYFLTIKGEGVGTLYRFSMTNQFADWRFDLSTLYNAYLTAKPESNTVGRVAEGLVHFSLRAFDTNGVEYATMNPLFLSTNIIVRPDAIAFAEGALPAWVELELGMVDPQVYRQYKLILGSGGGNQAAAANFLEKQAGKVYLFRERIPIRNHHEP
jgi:prepilin-type N-terminal cleavage/methylation domain-containing protein